MAAGMESLTEASQHDHLRALYELGVFERQCANKNKLNKRKHLNAAAEHFKKGFQANDTSCTVSFYNAKSELCKLDRSSSDILIDELKNGFRKGNPVAAQFIHCHNIHGKDKTAILTDPTIVLWLQLAAQTGCTNAQDYLIKSHKNKTASPYIYCALGILCTFGMLGARYSLSITRDPGKARKYFPKRITSRSGCIRYLHAYCKARRGFCAMR